MFEVLLLSKVVRVTAVIEVPGLVFSHYWRHTVRHSLLIKDSLDRGLTADVHRFLSYKTSSDSSWVYLSYYKLDEVLL